MFRDHQLCLLEALHFNFQISLWSFPKLNFALDQKNSVWQFFFFAKHLRCLIANFRILLDHQASILSNLSSGKWITESLTTNLSFLLIFKRHYEKFTVVRLAEFIFAKVLVLYIQFQFGNLLCWGHLLFEVLNDSIWKGQPDSSHFSL